MLLAALALTSISMWPALSGPFLFDDHHNLELLAAEGGLTDWETWRNYVFGGGAGPTGRPISLMTFTLNDIAWPSDAWPFKYTNLLIHLLNGLLVFVLATQLSRLAGAAVKGKEHYIGVAVMALWLLHPMQLSTIMAVVQRMTELSALFVLLGVIAYIHGRRVAQDNPVRGYLWMSAGIGLGGILATLSKENGILLPLFVLAAEFTVLDKGAGRRPRYWKAWSAAFLWLPLALLAAYFAMHWDSVLHSFERREFSFTERLLTQPRILFDYLQQIFIPGLAGSGLFHDDYAVSTGLLSPPATLLCILGLLGSLALAVWQRYRNPILALAILWFLAGHVLESSFIGLELYFEHRNYLPMFGPLLALGFYALQATGKLKMILPLMLAAFIALATAMTWYSSYIWGDAGRLAEVWAAENPSSTRAQQMAADYWFRQGRRDKARHYLNRALEHDPDRVLIHLQLLMLDCLKDDIDQGKLNEIAEAAKTSGYDGATFDTLTILYRHIETDQCAGLTYDGLLTVLNALLENPHYNSRGISRSLVHFAKARIFINQRKLNPAMDQLEKAYAAKPSPDIALYQAKVLLTAGLPEEALEYIKVARQADVHHKPLHSETRFIEAMEAAAKKMKAEQQNSKINN